MRFDLIESIEALRAGRKTQTRRRSAYWLKKQPGDRITIAHKGEYLGYATVVRTWRQTLGEMFPSEACVEGYTGVADFLMAWVGMYPDATAQDEVTAIEFKDIRWKA